MDYPKLLLSCQTLKQEQLSPVSIPEVAAPAVGENLLTGAQRIYKACVISKECLSHSLCYQWQWPETRRLDYIGRVMDLSFTLKIEDDWQCTFVWNAYKFFLQD